MCGQHSQVGGRAAKGPGRSWQAEQALHERTPAGSTRVRGRVGGCQPHLLRHEAPLRVVRLAVAAVLAPVDVAHLGRRGGRGGGGGRRRRGGGGGGGVKQTISGAGTRHALICCALTSLCCCAVCACPHRSKDGPHLPAHLPPVPAARPTAHPPPLPDPPSRFKQSKDRARPPFPKCPHPPGCGRPGRAATSFESTCSKQTPRAVADCQLQRLRAGNTQCHASA